MNHIPYGAVSLCAYRRKLPNIMETCLQSEAVRADIFIGCTYEGRSKSSNATALHLRQTDLRNRSLLGVLVLHKWIVSSVVHVYQRALS